MSLADNYVFVQYKQPFDTRGLTPLVRAANGNRTGTPEGFDYAQLARNWRRHLGHTPPVWTYIYPSTEPGLAVAALLAGAPDAPLYVLDIEDDGVRPAVVTAIARALSGHGRVGITTYGLVSQCTQRHLPIDAAKWDVVMPQVYYRYQARGVGEWDTLGQRVVPAVAPRTFPEWWQLGHTRDLAVWDPTAGDVGPYARRIAQLGGASQRQLPIGGDMPERAVTYHLPTLREGDVGVHVRDLQVLLAGRSYAIRADGAYGPQTAATVRTFQSVQHLTVDGVAGPATWHALLHLAYQP